MAMTDEEVESAARNAWDYANRPGLPFRCLVDWDSLTEQAREGWRGRVRVRAAERVGSAISGPAEPVGPTVESHEVDLGEALGCTEPATWDAMLTEVVRLREFETGVLIGRDKRESSKSDHPMLATTEERELWLSVVRSAQTPYGEQMSLADAVVEADALVVAYQARIGPGQPAERHSNEDYCQRMEQLAADERGGK